jgi:hypothetical protein
LKNPRAAALGIADGAGGTLLERIKRAVTKPPATKPAATALRVRPLLISAEIEKLRRGGSV